MPLTRPLDEYEIDQAENYDGTYFSLYEWTRRRVTGWANAVKPRGTLYTRFVEFLSHESHTTCERCGREGEWIISDVCVRCHKAVCARCVRLHYKLYASLCHECYKQTCHEFLREARRSERRKANVSNRKASSAGIS